MLGHLGSYPNHPRLRSPQPPLWIRIAFFTTQHNQVSFWRKAAKWVRVAHNKSSWALASSSLRQSISCRRPTRVWICPVRSWKAPLVSWAPLPQPRKLSCRYKHQSLSIFSRLRPVSSLRLHHESVPIQRFAKLAFRHARSQSTH